jgi:tryptophan-rich sensory protein
MIAASPRHRANFTAALAALAVAMLGGLATDIGPWYLGLKQPAWKPPDLLFGPVWTILYAMAAASAVKAWQRAPSKEWREWLLGLFALNGFLNLLWSLLFFRLRRPDWALLEVSFLWLSVASLMLFVWRRSRTSALLLLPYLAWVAFAGWLNRAVVALNGPFG